MCIFQIDTVILRVKATDKGNPPLSAFSGVTVSITDRKNNPPTWDSNNYEREYEVKETAPIAHVIASMRAQSNTEAPFDGVSFALIDSMENTVQQLGPFRIQQDGNTVTLILKGQLDYNVENRYELRLRVTVSTILQVKLGYEGHSILIQDQNYDHIIFVSKNSSYFGLVVKTDTLLRPFFV